MDNADGKDQSGLTKVEDLEHVVRVRKYRHCAAEYLKLWLLKGGNLDDGARPKSRIIPTTTQWRGALKICPVSGTR
jgi:hypothetical protein